jgi:predicted secreted protein
MAEGRGSLFILESEVEGVPGTYQLAGCFRSNGFDLSREEIDVTSKCDALETAGVIDLWKKQVQGGMASASIAGSGVVTDDAGFVQLETDAFSGVIRSYKITNELGTTYTGTFLINSFSRAGENGAEETFDVSLSSSGPVVVS